MAKDDDSEKYRCMAAAPSRAERREVSWGCFIVTSNKRGAIDKDADKPVFLGASAYVSAVLRMHGDDVENVIRKLRSEVRGE